jgi:hypothetical protein
MKTKSTAEAAESAEKNTTAFFCLLGVSAVISWPRLPPAQRI